MKFLVKTDDQKKPMWNLEHINAYFTRWKPRSRFIVEIKRDEPTQSDPMRAYYFSTVLPPIMKLSGYEKHEAELLHYFLKIKYFKDDPKYEIYQTKLGVWRNVPSVFGKKSTMPVSEKSGFVDWVIREASPYVYIPDPK